jgi:DnaJ-class molecular chaperone
MTKSKMVTGDCAKCDGKGKIRGFSHIANGTCFTCKGSGKVTVKITESNPVTPRVTIAAELGEIEIFGETTTAIIFSDGKFGFMVEERDHKYGQYAGPNSIAGRAIAEAFDVIVPELYNN